jgi:hypothetical protein
MVEVVFLMAVVFRSALRHGKITAKRVFSVVRRGGEGCKVRGAGRSICDCQIYLSYWSTSSQW